MPKVTFAFDMGVASLGEAVKEDNEIVHAEALLMDADVASIKEQSDKRRALRVRSAHKARGNCRNQWLDKQSSFLIVLIMNTVKLGGALINLKGDPPQEGGQVPDFKFVQQDLSELALSNYEGQYKFLMSVPSLDTGVCQKQTQVFNEKLAEKKNLVNIVISMDLPFAMQRFCSSEGIENIINASDFRYHEFADKFNLKIIDGALKGLIARAVFILDAEDKILYREIVPEIKQEPDYDKALEALNKVLQAS